MEYEHWILDFSVRILESEPWCVVAKAAPRLDSLVGAYTLTDRFSPVLRRIMAVRCAAPGFCWYTHTDDTDDTPFFLIVTRIILKIN